MTDAKTGVSALRLPSLKQITAITTTSTTINKKTNFPRNIALISFILKSPCECFFNRLALSTYKVTSSNFDCYLFGNTKGVDNSAIRQVGNAHCLLLL